jgi:hypothetical protein
MHPARPGDPTTIDGQATIGRMRPCEAFVANKKITRPNPLGIIALFTAMVEASALASLPFLDETSQTIYIWFLVGFPTFLAILFFATLNFNRRALYSPSDFESSAYFLESLDTDADAYKYRADNKVRLAHNDLHIIDTHTLHTRARMAAHLERLADVLETRKHVRPLLIVLVGQVPPPPLPNALAARLAELQCQVAALQPGRLKWTVLLG